VLAWTPHTWSLQAETIQQFCHLASTVQDRKAQGQLNFGSFPNSLQAGLSQLLKLSKENYALELEAAAFQPVVANDSLR